LNEATPLAPTPKLTSTESESVSDYSPVIVSDLNFN